MVSCEFSLVIEGSCYSVRFHADSLSSLFLLWCSYLAMIYGLSMRSEIMRLGYSGKLLRRQVCFLKMGFRIAQRTRGQESGESMLDRPAGE